MTLTRRGTAVGAGIIAVAMVVTACGKSGGTKSSGAKTTGKAGGTLNILMVADFEHLDPARNYVSQALNFSRLLYRTLTTYKSVAGKAGLDLAPDLATNLGDPSDGGKTWTFHLKDGLKYEDGTAITSQDVKYGVERSFSDLLPEGPQYAKQFLIGGANYKGPYKDKSAGGLASIETPDAKTIIFKLSAAHGDFNYTAALPTFSPIPVAKDTGVNYDKHVFSSGPYMIQEYKLGKDMKLVRNPNWNAKSDPVRSALPDNINVTFGLDPGVIDQRILANNGPDANAVQLDSSIQPENVAKVLAGNQYVSRTVGGYTGFLRYIAINTTHKPFDNVKVRQAISYCTNKEAQQTARGGKRVAGDITQQVLVPTVLGYVEYDPLGLKAIPQGDPVKGKALLAEAGVKNLKMTFQANDTGKGVKQATAFQAALARCGVKVTVNNLPSAIYYTTIGKPKDEADAVIAGWGPDWPSASTVIPPLFDSRQIKPAGNQIFSQFKGPEADALDAEMDVASADANVTSATAKWTALDHKITDLALYIPLLTDKAQYIWGSNVKNVFIHAFFGDPDMVALGVM